MDNSLVERKERERLDYPFGKTRPEPGTVMEVAPGIKWLSMPLPFALHFINLWLIEDGEGWAIVDTGLGDDVTREHWESIFANALEGRPVTRVFVTHMHPDHVGQAGWLTRRWDCSLYMSRLEYITCRMLVADTGREAPEAGVEFFRQAGWNEEALSGYRKRFGGFGRGISALPDSFHRLSDGDDITIGDHSWRVVVGTGHSPEHACLYCEALNVVIAGDQILPRISSNVSVHPTEPLADPLEDWLSSCEALKSALPEDVFVLPAHNEPFYGAHTRLDGLIRGHNISLQRLKKKLETPSRVVDCFTAMFARKIGEGNLGLATGETLAHLNYLVQRGEVRRELDEDGVARYSRTS